MRNDPPSLPSLPSLPPSLSSLPPYLEARRVGVRRIDDRDKNVERVDLKGGGKGGGREGWVRKRDVGRYGCQFNGLESADTMGKTRGREGEREGKGRTSIYRACTRPRKANLEAL